MADMVRGHLTHQLILGNDTLVDLDRTAKERGLEEATL